MSYNSGTMTSLFLLLALLQSPDEIRAKMEQAIGGLPNVRMELNARVIGRFERPGYRVEKVVFESLPGFRVTANLYVPTAGTGPFPAVLGVAGHSDNGKASATYQHMWISLARRGYVVLAYDPPGQGERLEYFDPELGLSRLGPGVREHIAAGVQCLLTGTSIARYFIWDGIRAMDYLLTRKEVDPTRVAVAGNSGGGTQAAYLAVFEPRLAAVVSSCYITRWQELMAGPGPQDAEQIFPGFLSLGLDFVDFIRSFAPKPFLVTSATQDFFPIAGARATYQAAAQYYESIDAPGRVSFFEYDDTHGWSQPRREAAYHFLDKHLKGVDAEAHEAPVQTEPESMLWVTPTGQLATSLGTETVFSLNRSLAQKLYPARKALAATNPEELRTLIRQRLALPQVKLVGRSAPPGRRPGIITSGVPESDLEQLRAAGYALRVVNSPVPPAGASGYSAAYQAAAKEWLNGRSLLTWRVTELRSAFYDLAAEPDVDPANISVWGRGNSGVAALLLAALEPQVARVMTEDTVTSWFVCTQSHLYSDLAEITVPGVLLDFDLPDLVKVIAPRSILLVDPRTPTGARSPAMEYPRAYVGLFERPEGWPVMQAFGPWLNSPVVRGPALH
ncbi:acetylxylan esterase [uncultured Paludibaculum sp.]|uniref:alpha/beta hydrolase family protein n=1 Tax=uncultured Paludibaculum sp. TaxID=1765020 RepID=UPI002AABEA61|nr:acetylxylan esterase [uncultured Paludibaculum sp.]